MGGVKIIFWPNRIPPPGIPPGVPCGRLNSTCRTAARYSHLPIQRAPQDRPQWVHLHAQHLHQMHTHSSDTSRCNHIVPMLHAHMLVNTRARHLVCMEAAWQPAKFNRTHEGAHIGAPEHLRANLWNRVQKVICARRWRFPPGQWRLALPMGCGRTCPARVWRNCCSAALPSLSSSSGSWTPTGVAARH